MLELSVSCKEKVKPASIPFFSQHEQAILKVLGKILELVAKKSGENYVRSFSTFSRCSPTPELYRSSLSLRQGADSFQGKNDARCIVAQKYIILNCLLVVFAMRLWLGRRGQLDWV